MEKISIRVSAIAYLLFVTVACSGQNPKQTEKDSVATKTKVVNAPVIAPKFFNINQNDYIQISAYIRKIYQDKKGNLWLGTNGDGVARFDGNSLEYFSKKEGFNGEAVRGIVEDQDGAVWFGTDLGVTKFDGESFINYGNAEGLEDCGVWNIMIDKSGEVWVGTISSVFNFDGKRFTKFALPETTVGANESRFSTYLAWKIFEDSKGVFWFGMDGAGLYRFDGKNIKIYTTKDGLCGNNVNDILEAKDGSLWFATRDGGISQYDGKTFINYNESNGLTSNFVYTMMQDKTGDIWFSTLGRGVDRYDGKSFTNYQEKQGVTRNHIQSIFEDNMGRLWFGFSGGLFRFEGNKFVNITKSGPWQWCDPKVSSN